MSRHLTPDERRQIVEGYIDGEKIEVLAIVFSVCESTIRRVRRRAGVPVRWHRNCGPRKAKLPLDAGADLPYT